MYLAAAAATEPHDSVVVCEHERDTRPFGRGVLPLDAGAGLEVDDRRDAEARSRRRKHAAAQGGGRRRDDLQTYKDSIRRQSASARDHESDRQGAQSLEGQDHEYGLWHTHQVSLQAEDEQDKNSDQADGADHVVLRAGNVAHCCHGHQRPEATVVFCCREVERRL